MVDLTDNEPGHVCIPALRSRPGRLSWGNRLSASRGVRAARASTPLPQVTTLSMTLAGLTDATTPRLRGVGDAAGGS